MKKVWTNPFTFFRKSAKNVKKHVLTPLHFFENESKMRKEALTKPSTFFRKSAKNVKKHVLTPLHFFKNEPKM